MVPFAALHHASALPPATVGELAWELAQLTDRDYPVVPSVVITAEVLEQTLAAMSSREPLLTEWPQLLGQAELTATVPLPRLLQRLRRTLLMAPVDLPWDEILALVKAPVLRLQPSLWLPEGAPTAPLTHLLGDLLCWADEHSLSQALKHLWGRLASHHSWAYWQRSPQSPQGLRLAVVLQPQWSCQASGTLKMQGDRVQVQVIQGCLQGLPLVQPDRYEGTLPLPAPKHWLPGHQDILYQPATHPANTSDPSDPLMIRTTGGRGLDGVSTAQIQALINRLRPLMSPAVPVWYVEWHLPLDHQILHLSQALPWPLRPPSGLSPTPPAVPWLQGRGAAPGQAIAPAWVVTGDGPSSAHPQEPHILVANQVLPSWLPDLNATVALISEQGGLTSHAAILARELGIPAVVALPEATQTIQTGQLLHLDGTSGRVEQLPNGEPLAPRRAPPPPPLALPSDQTKLWVNITQPERAAEAAQSSVAGVGLLRSEWLLLPSLDQRHPYHWVEQGEGDRLQQRLVDRLRPIVAAFAPRPVRYRSLDLRSHEMATLMGAPPIEANPVLGVRGTFSYRHHPHLFDLELAALRQLQREGHTNLQLLLPFVRTVEEFQFCRQRAIAAQLNREAAFQLWIMAEVPSVLFLLPDYQAAGVEGIAIGTNDLTQLMLGIDRDQAALAQAFNDNHPAVRAAIAHLLHQAQRLKLPTCLCGLMPSRDPGTIAELIHQGITGISVELGAVPDTAAAIAQATQVQTAIGTPEPL